MLQEQSPSASAPEPPTLEMLTEEEKACLSLLDLRAHGSTSESDPMDGVEGPLIHHGLSLIDVAEEIENAAQGDHAMHDVEEVKDEQPRYSGLSTITQVKGRVETKHRPESLLKEVRGLLATGLLEGFRVTYKNNEVEMTGRIRGQGYSCGCSACGYSNIRNACEFEQHAGESSNNQNAHIFLDSGVSLYKVIQSLKYKRLDLLGDLIEEQIGLPPNLNQFLKWKASFQAEEYDVDAAVSDPCSIQSSQESAAGVTSHIASATMTDPLKESTSYDHSNLTWNTFRRLRWQYKRGATESSTPALNRSPEKGTSGLSAGTSMKRVIEETPNRSTAGPLSLKGPPTDHRVDTSSRKQPKMRDNSLHQLVFKEGGLADLDLLTYKLKNGQVLKQGYKQGAGIICDCCKEEFTPSQFEVHAGMGKRRQPYRSIYTSEGLTLHELALKLQKLQGGLNSNGISGRVLADTDEPPNFASSSSSKESSTPDRPIIVPLKRTLQERLVKIESCYLCGHACTAVGIISEDTIVFCNQCERPCHIKCYNNGLQKQKASMDVLGEYVHFQLLCCTKCQLLRASLHQVMNKREHVPRQPSNIQWQLLSGRNPRRDVQQYMHQVTEIFKDAFPETAAWDSDIIQDMVNAKDVSGEKDFRGMYCAVLTRGKLVVSAAILKVRTEEFAELVLVATRKNCRNKGYFTLLLKQIESQLKALNVQFLMAPVDPELAPIWSEKLGFTILSDEEKKSLLEAHPLVMFGDLTLAQKSLVQKPDLAVSESDVTFGEAST